MEPVEGNIPMAKFAEYMQQEPPKTIVEIGSLDGADAVYFKSQFPNARVIAIEGLPANYTSNLAKLKEIETYQMVINSYDGKTSFYQKELNGIHGIFDRGKEYPGDVLTLECQRFDTFCSLNNIESVDAVKIDVEGATLEVLTGFGKMLSTVRIMHIETENSAFFTGQKLQKHVQLFLIERGFTPLAIAGLVIEANKSQFDEVWVAKDYGVK